jgi:hypothetical protein
MLAMATTRRQERASLEVRTHPLALRIVCVREWSSAAETDRALAIHSLELGLDIPKSGLDVQVALGCLPNDWR